MNHKDVEDMSMGFGMFAVSTLLLLIMYFPRSRQRTAMGEGLGLHPEVSILPTIVKFLTPYRYRRTMLLMPRFF